MADQRAALIKQGTSALLPNTDLVMKLRADPVALREVLNHHCSTALSLNAASTPTAPLWILAVMNGNDNMVSTRKMLSEQGSAVCGKTLTVRSVAYKCLSCGSDPTCIMCAECFARSPCRNHDYRMVHSGGGMCDCGDPTAWKKESFCDAHKGASDEDMLKNLPESFVAWITEALRAAIRFVVRCYRCAIEEASSDPRIAGEENIVRASQNILTRLTEFSSVSDASRRLIAVALATPCDITDVDAVPTPPDSEHVVFAKDSDDDESDAEVGDDDAFDTSSSSSNGEEDADSDEESQFSIRRKAADLFQWVAGDREDREAGGEDAARPQSVAAVTKYTLLDQLFLLDMTAPPKSAKPISSDIGKLCVAVGIDTEFRKAYLRAYAATAWHQSIRTRERGVKANLRRLKTTFLKSGELETLAVQVLTVGPIVNQVLVPQQPGGPTLLSAMIGSQLSGLAARGRKVTNALGFDLIVEKRQLRRRMSFNAYFHLRYINYTSLSPKMMINQRHISRGLSLMLAARQASEYRVERVQHRRDMDFDMWDLDGFDVCLAWMLHGCISDAASALLKAFDKKDEIPPLCDLLGLPAAYGATDTGTLSPPVQLGLPHFDKLVAHANNYARVAPCATIRRSALANAVVDRFGFFFTDLGEILTHIAASNRLGRKNNLLVNAIVQVNTVSGLSERRLSIPRFNILAESSPFTLHLSLSRLLALQLKAALDSVGTSSTAVASDDNSLVSSLVYDCVLSRAQACDAEITIPYLIDASLSPYLCLTQYVEQFWRTDFCAVHKHIEVYHSFMCGYNQELDLYLLQLLTATLGGSFMSAHLLSRFTWGATDTKNPPLGHWHYLRMCLSIATDTSKTAIGDALETRIVHALARRQLKRSDIERLVSSFEMDDDQKQLALEQQIDRVLKAVATTEKRKEGNVYRLTRESWKFVNPYHGAFTPYDVDHAAENFLVQNRALYTKNNEPVPMMPVVRLPTTHNPLLARVVEIVHTPSFVSIALSTILSRAQDKITTTAKPPPPPKPHVITAIDALTLMVSSAKAIAKQERETQPAGTYTTWKEAYAAAVDRIRKTACFVGDLVNDVPQLGKMLPVQLDDHQGLIHRALDCKVSSIKLAGTTYKIASNETVGALLQHLLNHADKLLSDIPTHYIQALSSVLSEMSDVAMAESSDSASSGNVSAVVSASEDAAAAKKAALKARQAALMSKLRQKNAESALVAEAIAAPAATHVDPAALADGQAMFHLGDCMTVFESIDNRCVFCSQASTANDPLFHMAQRSTSGVLRQLYSPSSPTELVTGHLNFCGHMSHESCFTKRVSHTEDLRSRGTGLSQLEAYLRGLHYKGVRYLTQAEALCPLCSRAVSILCPPVSNAANTLEKTKIFAMRAASAVMRTDIGRLFKVAEFEPIQKRLRSEGGDANAAPTDVTPSQDSDSVPEAVITAWGVLRTVSQQAAILGLQSSCGKMTTMRNFAGFAAMVIATRRVIASLQRRQQDALLKLAKGEARYKEYHCLASSFLAAHALPEHTGFRDYYLGRKAYHGLGLRPSVHQLLEHRAQLRTIALLRMGLTNEPLPGQRNKLSTVAAVDELTSKLDFRDLDAALGGEPADEVSKLERIAQYCFSSDADDTSTSASVDDHASKQSDGDVVESFRQTLVAKFTAHLARKYAEQQEFIGKRNCSECGTETTNLVKCLQCAALLCSRNAKPELKAHAAVCGSGTQVYLEMQTSKLIVVQAVNQRASLLPPLYVDKHGETDVGLRRGLPLQLEDERVLDLLPFWLTCAWDHLTSALHQDTWLINERPI